MKPLLALMFVVLSQCVWAQAPCSYKEASAIDGGASTVPAGLWASRWCLGADKSWHLFVDVISAADAVTVASEWIATLNATDYPAAVAALRLKYPQIAGDVNGPALLPIWQNAKPRIMAARPADPIPPAVWTVALNGTAKTRQWYAFDPITLTLGAKTSGAAVGAPCWPDVGGKSQIEAGKEVFYLPFGVTRDKALPTRVTVCTKA